MRCESVRPEVSSNEFLFHRRDGRTYVIQAPRIGRIDSELREKVARAAQNVETEESAPQHEWEGGRGGVHDGQARAVKVEDQEYQRKKMNQGHRMREYSSARQ